MTLDHLLYFVAGLQVGAAVCLLVVLRIVGRRSQDSSKGGQ